MSRRPTSARPTPARRSTSAERRGSVNEHPSRRKAEDLQHECRAAYLVVVDDLDDRLTTRDQLRNVLHQTGRNPSNRALDKYWKSDTDSLTFEDVVHVCKQLPATTEDDLMKAFRKIDINGDGYISSEELFKTMTTKGEKMSRKEVQTIIDEVDDNKDGRLDYKEPGDFLYEKFCQMMMSTQEEATKIAKQRYEKKRQRQEASAKSKNKSPKERVDKDAHPAGSEDPSHRKPVEKEKQEDPKGSQISAKQSPSPVSKTNRTPRRMPRIATPPSSAQPVSTASGQVEREDGDSHNWTPLSTPRSARPQSSVRSVSTDNSQAEQEEGSIHNRTPRRTPHIATPLSSGRPVSTDDALAVEKDSSAHNKPKPETSLGKDKDVDLPESLKEESIAGAVGKAASAEPASGAQAITQSADGPNTPTSEADKPDPPSDSDEDDIVVGSQISLRNGHMSSRKEAPSRTVSQASLRSTKSTTKSDSDSGSLPKAKPRRPRDPIVPNQSDDVKASPRPKDRTKSPISTKRIKLPEPKRLKDWNMTHSKGCFYFEEDGLISSHHYSLSLPKDSSVWITIEPSSVKMGGEINSSREVGVPPVDTALFVLREKPDDEGNMLITFTEQRDAKGRYCVRCDLEKGRYSLLPFTTGCRFQQRKSEPNVETKLVRKDKDKFVLTKVFKETLSDIFDMCDLDGNGLINRDEFNWFNVRTSGEEVADDEWDVVEENVELKNGEMTRTGFISLNQMEAEDNEGDAEDLWVTLNSMGYNRSLVQDEAVPFILEVCAEDCTPSLKVVSISPAPNKLDKAMCQVIVNKGDVTKVKSVKDLSVYTWVNDFRAAIAVENKGRSRLSLQLDCSKSRNCSTHRSDLSFTLEVPPKATVIGHHILPANERQEWCLRFVDAVVK